MNFHDIKGVYLAPIFLRGAITYSRSFLQTLLLVKFVDTKAAKGLAKLIESELIAIKNAFDRIEKKIPTKLLMNISGSKMEYTDATGRNIERLYAAIYDALEVVSDEKGSVYIAVHDVELRVYGMHNTEKIDILRQMLEKGASDSEIVNELKKIIDK